ncbi:MAG: ribosome biogenesis GTP-binding protein YihA/YsxC [Bacteroidia bacterium]|nr:ribosome biogenesis GTP-binding protein YihA/YsxC [Bacteroidia bacterium]
MSDKLVQTALFKASYPNYEIMPDFHKPEFAFIGRSNVGKSSLINMLTGRKELALTSSKPGKTKQIVCFEIDTNWMLVDLPGFGYAKTSMVNRMEMSGLVKNYLKKRQQLFGVFLLIDIRHKPQAIDLDFMEWCAYNKVPFMMAFTKSDKLKPKEIEDTVRLYNEALQEDWEELPQQFICSSLTGEGREDILKFIKSFTR